MPDCAGTRQANVTNLVATSTAFSSRGAEGGVPFANEVVGTPSAVRVGLGVVRIGEEWETNEVRWWKWNKEISDKIGAGGKKK